MFPFRRRGHPRWSFAASWFVGLLRGPKATALLLIGGLALGASVGCAGRQVQLETVFAEAHENEIGALDKYEGETLRVSGIVSRMGLKSRSEVEAEFLGGRAVAKRVTRQVPYVVITSGWGEGNSLVCFFADRKEAATLREGAPVVVKGDVYRISVTGENALVYMEDCQLTK